MDLDLVCATEIVVGSTCTTGLPCAAAASAGAAAAGDAVAGDAGVCVAGAGATGAGVAGAGAAAEAVVGAAGAGAGAAIAAAAAEADAVTATAFGLSACGGGFSVTSRCHEDREANTPWWRTSGIRDHEAMGAPPTRGLPRVRAPSITQHLDPAGAEASASTRARSSSNEVARRWAMVA
jgi:hypothetical protein